MNIVSKLSLSRLKFNEDSETYLVVGLTAPVVDWQTRRASVCMMLVIDISGSMAGAKLEEAKKSARKIIENLKSTDYCGVVIFDDVPMLVSSPLKMSAANKENLTAKVKTIRPDGSTNFVGGMVMGLNEVNKSDMPKDTIVRVVMLTDGQANVGVSDEAGICEVLRNQIGAATVSAFGYGAGASQDLLASVAKTGRGNYAFISNEDDALSTYAKELGGLLSMYARNINIHLVYNGEVFKSTVVTDVPVTQADKIPKATLSDILSEETRNIVVSFKANAISQADVLFEPVENTIKVDISYDLIQQDGSTQTQNHIQFLKVSFVNPDDADTNPDKDLVEIIAKAQMVCAQLDAEVLAKSGDYAGAVTIMNACSSSLHAQGATGIANLASKIGSKMASQSVYAASAGYRTSSYTAGTRGMGVSSLDDEAAEDMEVIGTVLTNSAQDSVVQSFTTPTTPPPDPDSK